MSQAFITRTKNFLKDLKILSALISGVILWLVAFSLVYVELFPMEEVIIGRLNIRGEIDALIDVQSIGFIAGGLAIVFGLNTLLSMFFYIRERALSYFIVWASVWVMALGALMMYALTVMN